MSKIKFDNFPRLTCVSVNVLIVVSDPQVPEDGGLVEVAQGRHVVHPVEPEVLTRLHLLKFLEFFLNF
jgi:hypothetical protein